MTTTEFDRWYEDLTARFPSVETWLEKHAPDAGDKRRMLRNWCVALDDVPLADAIEANRAMQAGDLPWVGDYDSDKERLPRHLRGLTRQMASDRRPSENREQFAPAISKSGGFPAKAILLRLWELKRGGMDHDEAREIALREFPVGESPFRPQRYNCPTCLDTFRVLIASNTAIEAMLLGRFAECHHREGASKCHCRGHEGDNPKRPIVTYDPSMDFKIEDPLWRPAEVQRFSEWVAWHQRHRLEESVKGHVGYRKEFSDWNNQP
jgi:hypothetical protein